jgi:hypothetical protein
MDQWPTKIKMQFLDSLANKCHYVANQSLDVFFQTENVLEHQVTSRDFKHQTWRNNRLRRTEHFPSRVERSNSCILAESPTAMIPVREMTIHYGNRWKYDISQLTDYVCMNKLENWWPSSFTQNFVNTNSPQQIRAKMCGVTLGPIRPGR